MNYHDFLEHKQLRALEVGFDVEAGDIHPLLFDWQNEIVRWACRVGKAALFEECGLGKTLQQIEWARLVVAHLRGQGAACAQVLIVAPLAVAHQTVAEGHKIGVDIHYIRHQDEADADICITNYDMLKEFDGSRWGGVVLDESSILKAYTGATKRMILEMFESTPYKLACTATPAPNDHLELGNHAQFLNVMQSNEMIQRWFINDTMSAGAYRLKRHAETDYWRWVTSWAVCISKPSDLGYSDAGFDLPPLEIESVVVGVDHTRAFDQGQLLLTESLSATGMWKEKRATLSDRCDRAGAIVDGSDEPWIIWCDTNDEADYLRGLFPDAVEVRGDHSREYKMEAALWFTGEIDLCQLKSKEFCAKLASWQKQNVNPATGKSTTKNTEMNDSLSQSSTEENIPNRGENISPPITRQIKSGYVSRTGRIENEPEKKEMQSAANSTRMTQPSENLSSEKSRNGHETIRTNHSLKTLNSSDLPRKNTPKSSVGRVESVLSAERTMPILEDTDCTLTTITQPERLEDSYAEAAISESENSEITQNSLKKQLNTLDQPRARKILISKPDVYGWGLNFQHCHNQVFVGVTYSFEKTYQALRRSWRFGQRERVRAYLIYAETEGDIVKTLQIKQEAHARMQRQMNRAMKAQGLGSARDLRSVRAYVADTEMTIPNWLRSYHD